MKKVTQKATPVPTQIDIAMLPTILFVLVLVGALLYLIIRGVYHPGLKRPTFSQLPSDFITKETTTPSEAPTTTPLPTQNIEIPPTITLAPRTIISGESATITSWEGDFSLSFEFPSAFPEGVTISKYLKHNRYDTWETIALERNGKGLMIFSLPYESYPQSARHTSSLITTANFGKLYELSADTAFIEPNESRQEELFNVAYLSTDQLEKIDGLEQYTPAVFFKRPYGYFRALCVDNSVAHRNFCRSIMSTLKVTEKTKR